MAVARTMFVTLDCADARVLAEFWAAMLGGRIVFSTQRSVGVRNEAGRLAAMVVADYRPPTWPESDVPKQIHLDLGVDDLEAAVAEAIRQGATPAALQPAPETRRILLDPAGHPFCLTTMIPRESNASTDTD